MKWFTLLWLLSFCDLCCKFSPEVFCQTRWNTLLHTSSWRLTWNALHLNESHSAALCPGVCSMTSSLWNPAVPKVSWGLLEYENCAGERGGEMLDILKKNPAVCVDICLMRLTQKLNEWEKDQARMTPMWQKTYDANYHKSLDHRSFYFKQVCCWKPSPFKIYCNINI